MFKIPTRNPEKTLVVPSASESFAVEAPGVPFTLGTKEELISTSLMSNDFSIAMVLAQPQAASANYELHFFKGEVGSEILVAQAAITSEAAQRVPIQTAIFPRNTRISAAVMSSAVDLDSIKFKVQVTTYANLV